MRKLKLALYWASACGGCDVAVLDTHEKILDIAGAADIVFWPVAVDTKYDEMEKMPAGSIDVTLFHGAIRNSENEHIACLLRERSRVMVAFGSCAVSGGIPALANFMQRQDILKRIYQETPSTDNTDCILPQTSSRVPQGELTLPSFYDEVKTLDQVVDVDYYMPGCPPSAARIWEVMQAIISGALPPKGATVGVTNKTVCDECPREKHNKKISAFYRPHQIIPDPNQCLLEQGLVCLGPVTRGGCGAQCISANMPCRGCYGPMPGIIDQGAKFISALGSIVDAHTPEDAVSILSGIADPAGTFYRFSMGSALLKEALRK